MRNKALYLVPLFALLVASTAGAATAKKLPKIKQPGRTAYIWQSDQTIKRVAKELRNYLDTHECIFLAAEKDLDFTTATGCWYKIVGISAFVNDRKYTSKSSRPLDASGEPIAHNPYAPPAYIISKKLKSQSVESKYVIDPTKPYSFDAPPPARNVLWKEIYICGEYAANEELWNSLNITIDGYTAGEVGASQCKHVGFYFYEVSNVQSDDAAFRIRETQEFRPIKEEWKKINKQ